MQKSLWHGILLFDKVKELYQVGNAYKQKSRKPYEKGFRLPVGMTGFEPATSASRTQRSTKLSHIPIPLLQQLLYYTNLQR